MTKSDELNRHQTNNLNKIDLKLNNLDNYNNERLLTAVSSNNLRIHRSDFITDDDQKGPKVVQNESKTKKYGELVVIGYF